MCAYLYVSICVCVYACMYYNLTFIEHHFLKQLISRAPNPNKQEHLLLDNKAFRHLRKCRGTNCGMCMHICMQVCMHACIAFYLYIYIALLHCTPIRSASSARDPERRQQF